MEFHDFRFRDVAQLVNGRAYLMPELQSEGKYKIVRVGNFTGKDEWFYSDMELDEDKYCYKGDLLYKWACTFGPEIWKDEKTIYHYHIWKVIPKSNFSKGFLYYYLKMYTPYWLGSTNGATMVHITKSTMEKKKVFLPSYEEQCKIADILLAYDDLIENNNRRIALLEKAAQELYKEWFVRFRFPGYETTKFENGLPYGWVYDRLSAIMSFGAGKERPSSGNVYPVYGGNGILDYCDSYNNENAIIIGRVGAYCGSVYYEPAKCWISDNALYAISKNNAIYFNYYMLKHLNLNARQVGTGQPLITQGLLNKIKTIIPSDPLIHKYNSVVSDLLLQQRYLKQKNESLTKQRDLLLPRLMSGKLEV